MTDKEINIAIAEACGWTEVEPCTCCDKVSRGYEPTPGAHKKHLPDYANDLNAMHEAEDNLLRMNKAEFAVQLCRVVGRDWPSGIGGGSFAHIHATAAQRAEAFLRTIGKWDEIQP